MAGCLLLLRSKTAGLVIVALSNVALVGRYLAMTPVPSAGELAFLVPAALTSSTAMSVFARPMAEYLLGRNDTGPIVSTYRF
jgi:hypothetical protein